LILARQSFRDKILAITSIVSMLSRLLSIGIFPCRLFCMPALTFCLREGLSRLTERSGTLWNTLIVRQIAIWFSPRYPLPFEFVRHAHAGRTQHLQKIGGSVLRRRICG